MSVYSDLSDAYGGYAGWLVIHELTMDDVVQYLADFSALRWEAWLHWNELDDHSAIGDLLSAVVYLKTAIQTLMGYDYQFYRRDMITDSFLFASCAPNLNWQSIVGAWEDADMLGRLWTILSIDFMRKEVWLEPVTSFAMRSGRPFE